MQWTTVQHDIDHMHKAFYVAHCEDESKKTAKNLTIVKIVVFLIILPT